MATLGGSPSPRWRRVDKSLGTFALLGEAIADCEQPVRGSLPDFSSATTVFVLSDYSGEHRGAGYEVLSFLMFDPRTIGRWHKVWEPVRRACLPDGRRMAFKSLSDGRRRRAMPAFLHAANQIDGLLLTVALNQRLPPLFADGEYPPTVEGLQQLRMWKRKPYLKMLTAVNIVSVLIAGLGHHGQDIFWFSDEDDIAASPRRLRDVCDVFARVSSHYLRHNFRHFRFGTSKSDDGSKMLEDLLAIPDIVAGSVSDIMTNYRVEGMTPTPRLVTPIPSSTTWKAAGMVPWLKNDRTPLKRIVMSLEPTGQGEEKFWRRWTFHAFGREPSNVAP